MNDVFAGLRRSIVGVEPRRPADFDRRPRGERSAAVLLLLSDEPDPSLTVLRRASTLRFHAGQVALPGGRVDETDAGPVETALREAREEVGLESVGVDVLGTLPALWVPASNYDVTPVVGVWPGGPLRPVDPAETASVHQHRVSELASAAVRATAVHPLGYRGPAFVLPDIFIWGLTAHLIDWMLDLGEWTQPWDRAREVPIPRDYLRD